MVYNCRLLMESYKDRVLKMVGESRVCIIKGPTGCGKSTYVPYILHTESTRIAIVEPRRVAVKSLYNALSKMMKNVGYKMRFDKIINKETKTVIYTDGCFLNEIDALHFDFIIVDEVHERSVRMDTILAMLRDRIQSVGPRIVLMSATVNTEKVARYFEASVLEITGASHPSRVEYLQECTNDYIVEAYCVIRKIIDEKDRGTGNGDILVFLPGEEDIKNLYTLLKKLPVIRIYKIFSALSDVEQDRIFELCGMRKVILSTNICETSLTIPGVGFVVDSGLNKVKIYDGVSYFGIRPISKESADQRLGRCNRTGPGVCYRLYTKNMYDALQPQIPEICRSDLSQMLLQLINCGKNVFDLNLLDYPTRSNVVSGLTFLLEKGCVKIICRERAGRGLNNDLVARISKEDTQLCETAKIECNPLDVQSVIIKITGYGRRILRYSFDPHLSHFYEQALKRNAGYFASILISMVSQDNCNFLRLSRKNTGKTDIKHLTDIFEGYLECENKQEYCLSHQVPMKGMENALRIFNFLKRKKEGDIEDIKMVFSYSYQHNLCERIGDGSYKHVKSGEIVWIHPGNHFFKCKDKFIVFVDTFHTGKTYARIVGKHF